MFSPTKVVATAFLLGYAIICSAQTTLNPSWIYSSYFGGSQQDNVSAATRDSEGNIYIAGTSASPDFPTTPGVYEPAYPGPAGDSAVFVSKFSAEGQLVWSTFLGPATIFYAVASGIQVDSSQNVYVTGVFQDHGFPTTPGLPHNGDVFVSKLNAAGSQLVYSAVMAINSSESAPKVVLDSLDDAFVIGSGPAGACCNGHTGIIGPAGGIGDFWVAEINAAGNGVPWSVTIGGTGLDQANSIAIDSANKLYIAGYSDSLDFPTTPGALNQPGGGRSFVVKLDPTLPPSKSMIYGAMIGDPGNSSNSYIEAQSIAVDQSGNAFVGAWTYNLCLFTSKWAFQPNAPTIPNAYVFELNSAGSSIVNGTYLGGGAADYAGQVSVDASGNVYVSGFTDSWDFLTTAYGNPPLPYNYGQSYYAKLNPAFAAISSVEFGSLDDTTSWASVPDGAGGLWVTATAGHAFPTTPNAYQPLYKGNYDGVLLHTNFEGLCSTGAQGVAICTLAADTDNSERIHFESQSADLEGAADISINIDGMYVYAVRAAQLDTSLPVAPGNHLATIIARHIDGTRNAAKLPFSVTASSSCPLNPMYPSITLCNPLNAGVVKGPLTVVAQDNSSAPPASVQLFVDGKLVTTIQQGNNGSYSYTLQPSPGVHRVSVQGKDSSGVYVATTAVLRVVQ